MKIPSTNQGRTCCVQILFLTFRAIFVHNMFSQCFAKRRASYKDLPELVRKFDSQSRLIQAGKYFEKPINQSGSV